MKKPPVKTITIYCVEIPESRFRWFGDEGDARIFAMALYNTRDVIMNEHPIYEHWVETSSDSICEFLNIREH